MNTETKTVKNVSGTPLDIVGIGHVETDGTVEVPVDFNNANFEDVKTTSKSEQRRIASMKEAEAKEKK